MGRRFFHCTLALILAVLISSLGEISRCDARPFANSTQGLHLQREHNAVATDVSLLPYYDSALLRSGRGRNNLYSIAETGALPASSYTLPALLPFDEHSGASFPPYHGKHFGSILKCLLFPKHSFW
jgi:hypothetical protein